MKKIFLLLSVFIYSCASSPSISISEGESVIKTKAGKTFSVKLDSQLSTGYSWKITEIPQDMAVIKEIIRTEESEKTGGFDIQEFVFKSNKSGGIIVFKYGEHWKQNPSYIKTARILVQAE